MSRPKITDQQRVDAFLNTATKEQLLRLDTDTRAALRWKYGVVPEIFLRAKAQPKLFPPSTNPHEEVEA